MRLTQMLGGNRAAFPQPLGFQPGPQVALAVVPVSF